MSTWILLRGLMREARHWGDFPGQLAAALPGATIIAPDLPGNGRLRHFPSPTRIEPMVQCCRRQLQNMGVAPPYFLLALSLGAMAATAWSTAHPEEVAGAVLLNTSLRSFSPFYHRLRPHNYARLASLAFCIDLVQRERLILELTSQGGLDAAVLEAHVAVQRHSPVSRANALRQLLAAIRYHAPSAPPAVPVLLLASAGDRLVDMRCSQRLAQAWSAPLEVHPQAGHDLPLDDGAWVARQVGAWAERQAARPH